MRVLISGGTGYIGGRLAVHLSLVGHKIVLGSRKVSGPPDWLPDAEIVQTKWDESDELSRICRDIDVVIHAAGMNAQDCLADPVSALEFNGVATARFVSAAAKAGVKRFIYLSTAHVYGSPLSGRISEDTCPKNLHPYATSHLSGEHALLASNDRREIQGIVFRLSNAFGAPVSKDSNSWNLLVNDLCRQAVEKKTLSLRSSGKDIRDFISLSKVCNVIELFVSSSFDTLEAGIFNLGTGYSSTVLNMARLIQQRCLKELGHFPGLHIDGETNNNDSFDLEYKSSRMPSLAIDVDASKNITELDHLLKYCNHTFGSCL
jgi:UDP-glucose 4-epimerase